MTENQKKGKQGSGGSNHRRWPSGPRSLPEERYRKVQVHGQRGFC